MQSLLYNIIKYFCDPGFTILVKISIQLGKSVLTVFFAFFKKNLIFLLYRFFVFLQLLLSDVYCWESEKILHFPPAFVFLSHIRFLSYNTPPLFLEKDTIECLQILSDSVRDSVFLMTKNLIFS